MKKLLLFIIVCNLIVACNSSNNSSTTTDSTSTNQTNVENVNGNVPDSGSGINLNHSLPIDSSRMKDSLKKDSARH
jgi:uncharacterized protein YcfL